MISPLLNECLLKPKLAMQQSILLRRHELISLLHLRGKPRLGYVLSFGCHFSVTRPAQAHLCFLSAVYAGAVVFCGPRVAPPPVFRHFQHEPLRVSVHTAAAVAFALSIILFHVTSGTAHRLNSFLIRYSDLLLLFLQFSSSGLPPPFAPPHLTLAFSSRCYWITRSFLCSSCLRQVCPFVQRTCCT